MKHLIVCIDGTSNSTETGPGFEGPTNVLLFSRALLMRNANDDPQIVNYIRGVGTDKAAEYGRTNKLWQKAGRTWRQMRGSGLSQIVQDAYGFLSHNYERGDNVYILGFSRGAAVARSLSGLSELFGVLPKSVIHEFPRAWDYYNRDPQTRNLASLKQQNSILGSIAEVGERLRSAHEKECEQYGEEPLDILRDFPHAPLFPARGERGVPLRSGREDNQYVPMPLHFLGVWDTVFAAPTQGYHEFRLAWNVGSAYHALAIHEVRDDFKPVLWERKCRHQEVVQTWFKGSHSDVGGGNRNGPGLSSISLDWMIERVKRHSKASGCQIEFDPTYMARISAPNPAGPLTYPQDEIFWQTQKQSARIMGGEWHGSPLQFKSKWADSRPASYNGASRGLLDLADKNSQGLPPER